MKKEDNANAQDVIKRLDEQLNKYKFMEVHLQARRKKLKSQIPDIKSSLQIVKEMKTRKDTAEVIETRFLLSDQVYMKASIPPTDRVCLWLGANVMLEYGLEDAEGLLSKNLGNATKNLTQVEHDLDFLKKSMHNNRSDDGPYLQLGCQEATSRKSSSRRQVQRKRERKGKRLQF
ncbi:hypothetical protein OTU49_011867 [Cherax quadricarinatus]|uniref:Prefoldin subunit 3 n=1 Tax=Cherax quadricarinatus TaxID=27406 RepID=A0AAW0W2S7_CHEQU